MQQLKEGKLTFQFPDGWLVAKYDEWSFYRNQLQSACCGNKAVDFLAFDPQEGKLWLIEVKDFREHRREKGIPLWDEVTLKARDTLAGLVCTRIRGISPEQDHSRSFLKAIALRVVLHLEQPRKPSKLFPREFDPALVMQKLRQQLRPIDPHPRVAELNSAFPLPWSVV